MSSLVASSSAGQGTSGRLRQVWIDVGGTFTDCVALDEDGTHRVCKVLSSGIVKGRVAGFREGGAVVETSLRGFPEGFFRGYGLRTGDEEPAGGEAYRVEDSAPDGALRIEGNPPGAVREGMPFELLSGEPAPVLGIRMLERLRLDRPLGAVEVRLGTTRATNALLERKGARTAWVTTCGFADVLAIGYQNRPRLFDLHIRKPAPLYECAVEVDERVGADGRVLTILDEEGVRRALQALKSAGIESLAIGCVNAYANGAHERRMREMAGEAGFRHISISSVVSPTIRLVPRGDTTVVDAYLTPVVREYLAAIASSLPERRLRVMTSAGALTAAGEAQGKDLVLSGPAGGVVGFSMVAREEGLTRAIGFDMGGTSTDVSRFDGEHEYEHETTKAGVRIVSPMLAIETVAAGGGSICRFDGQKLTVGPESAGADPGPACYGRGGPLTLTDVNLFLGRVRPEHFPFELDCGAAERRLDELCRGIGEAGGAALNRAETAEGCRRIANAHMAAAIRRISVERGYDVRSYALVSFGGAAGQHACAVADELGIRTICVPSLASVLSARGMGRAEAIKFAVRPVLAPLDASLMPRVEALFEEMMEEAAEAMERDEPGVGGQREIGRTLELRYRGQNTALSVEHGEIGAVRKAFEAAHRQLYGHVLEGRAMEVVHARLRMASSGAAEDRHEVRLEATPYRPEAEATHDVMMGGELRRAPVYRIGVLRPGAEVPGPALLVEEHSTVVVEAGWAASMTTRRNLKLERSEPVARETAGLGPVNAVDLELFHNHFGAIAEEMGATLRRTALSVNVKERLDFSCAIFTAGGDLVANAPHVPVHLGAMSECVKRVLEEMPDLAPGDVVLTNDPMRGGSHLPDVTVVTPVFGAADSELLFFTGSRAHHAEIGGIRPGSMPPDSRNLAEEGVVLRPFKVVERGVSRMEALEERLTRSKYPSRSPGENLADAGAQIAANHRGALALVAMMERFGRETTLAYMGHIQEAARVKMEACLRRLGDGVYRFEDAMDDGSAVRVEITIRDGLARLDFGGSAGVHPGNLNANRAIVNAAVIYCFRCMMGEEIPLNSGVLAPLEIVLPEGMLNPPAGDDPERCPAVAGGNVETSQRIVDVILGAMGAAAASQGTMNNLAFGNERFGYYETICGGSGAGPGFEGADAVHTHMTNTRLTDVEVLEREYPVRVRRFEIRKGSGGAGAQRGGDGVRRELEFLAPVAVSLLTQRRRRRPYGLAGGEPGQAGRNVRIRRLSAGGETQAELGPGAQFDAAPGDRLLIETPGGGGYGPPPKQP